MKYLKKFATRAEYEAYMVSNESFPFVGYIKDEEKVEYPVQQDESLMPFYVKASEDLTISLSRGPVQYSIDNVTWVDLPAGEATPIISAGSKVYFRAELSPASGVGIGKFTISGKCDIGGNIMSLLYGADFIGNNTIKSFAFYNLFNGQPIVNAARLVMPAMKMQQACYYRMFMNCTNLVYSPKLPATEMGTECYYGMFNGCTNLVSEQILPATSLASSCYGYMYNRCSKLSYIKMMATASNALSGTYTYNWVEGVSATGKFVSNVDALWTESFGKSAIPTGWTIETATE